MSGSAVEFADITSGAESSTVATQSVAGQIYESITEPYTDPSTGATTELSEIIPVTGLVSVNDTTADGLVVPLGTIGSYNVNDYDDQFILPAVGANVLTVSVVSPGSVPATSLPAGETNTTTLVLLPSPITANDATSVINETVDQSAGAAGSTIAPFSQVAVTDPNPLQVLSAAVVVSAQVPYTLSLPNLQDLSASALAAALDQVTLTFTGTASGTDTVAATITDIAGESATLTTQASVIEAGSPPQPISVSDGAASVADDDDVDAGQSANTLQVSPFQGVSFNEPNPGRLESVTITVSGPVAATLSATSLQDLAAAQVAAALDAETLTFSGEASGTDVVTATITDTDGQSTTLTSADSLAFTNAAGTLVAPVSVATITGASGAVTGAAEQQLLNSADMAAVTSPLAGATVALYDGGVEVDAVTTGPDGSFATNPLQAADGGNLTASVVPVLGSGPDTLALFVSERGAPEGAQFTISVDGTQIGGVQTTVATGESPGQAQEFDVDGTFSAAMSHTVSIAYLNADQSLLQVDSATIDGMAVASASTVLANIGTAGFGFTTPSIPTIGSGADEILLDVSQIGAPDGAEFTVSINGVQIGGVQTAYTPFSSISSAPVSVFGPAPPPNFAIEGNFPNGTDTLTFTYLNASNSIFTASSALVNRADTQGSEEAVLPTIRLDNNGSGSDSFANYLTIPTAGSGPDALELTTSERGEPAGAQFTVSVDGQQVGGVQTTAADATAGQSQSLVVLGDFAPGVSHGVAVNYLNADNSLLLVDSATINGTTIAGGDPVLSNNGSAGFSFVTPTGVPASPTAVGGSGPDTLALTVSEDYFQANAQFTIDVDGNQVGEVQTATAINGNGESQAFDVLGQFAGTHSVSVTLMNPAFEGSNAVLYDPPAVANGLSLALHVGGATIDGTAVSGSTLLLSSSAGSGGFTFTH